MIVKFFVVFVVFETGYIQHSKLECSALTTKINILAKKSRRYSVNCFWFFVLTKKLNESLII
jgi:hypothetical protein